MYSIWLEQQYCLLHVFRRYFCVHEWEERAEENLTLHSMYPIPTNTQSKIRPNNKTVLIVLQLLEWYSFDLLGRGVNVFNELSKEIIPCIPSRRVPEVSQRLV